MKKIWCGLVALSALLAGGAELPEAAKPFAGDLARELKDAAEFSELEPGVYAVRGKDGKTLGKLYLEKGVDDKRRFGYAGTVEVAVFVDNDDRVAGVLIGKNQETPSYLRRVRDAGFLKSWNSLKLEDVPGREVDTVTRATYSSSAIRTGVRNLATARTKGEAAVPVPTAEQDRTEIVQLEQRAAMLSRIVSGSRALLEQLTNRKDEELQLRLAAALEGPEAAKKFADEHKMILFSHSGRNPQKTPVELAAEKYKASRSEEDLKTLKAEIQEAYEQLLETVPPHNAEQEKALAAVEARLEMLRKRTPASAPQAPPQPSRGGMKFRSPEAQAEQEKIEKLAAAYRQSRDPKVLEELRAEVNNQLERGVAAMSARVAEMERELARVKESLAEFRKDPDAAARKRIDELTR